MAETPKAPGRNPPVLNLQVKLPVATRADLVARHGAELGQGRLFVRTRVPKPVGTRLRVDLKLADGTTVLRGIADVTEAATADEAPERPGMQLVFRALDPEGQAFVRGSSPPATRPAAARPAPPVSASGTVPADRQPRPGSESAGAPSSTPSPPAPEVAVASPVEGSATDGQDRLRPRAAPAPASTIERRPAAPPLGVPPASGASGGASGLDKAPAPVPEATTVPGSAGGPGEPAGSVAAASSEAPATSATRRPPARSGPVVGIDLGTTNSCVAWAHHGKPVVIPSREGYNVVPSVVAVNDQGRLLVGQSAKGQLLTNPANTVYGAKRLVGRPFHSPVVSGLKEHFSYPIVEGPKGEAAVSLGGKTYTLQTISAFVLKELREVARGKLGQDVHRAVITVPAYYNEHQREAVREAGEIAGLHVERILNEPTAAALAFGYGKNLEKRLFVYDLGGGTFDASVLELHGGSIYEVVSTGGDTFLGGVDFDLELLEVLKEKFAQQNGVPFEGDRVALQRMLDAAERAKAGLSEAETQHVRVPFVAMRGERALNLDVTVTRQELQKATEHLVDRTLKVTNEVLAAKGLKPTDIDEVLLVGGQSRMPLVRDKVRAFFGKDPHHGVHPDEAVALGAALLAQTIATDTVDGVVLIDVLPMSIGVGLPGGRFKRIVERNTALPFTRTHTLQTTHDQQTTLEVHVFQGESESALENELLGSVRLSGLPKAARGAVKVDLTFRLSREALLTIVTREEATGSERRLELATQDTPEKVRQRLQALAPGAAKVGLWGRLRRWLGGRASA